MIFRHDEGTRTLKNFRLVFRPKFVSAQLASDFSVQARLLAAYAGWRLNSLLKFTNKSRVRVTVLVNRCPQQDRAGPCQVVAWPTWSH